MGSRRAIIVILALLIAGTGAIAYYLGHPATRSPAAKPSAAQSPAVVTGTVATVYVHYYLWWTAQHWRDLLGPSYPYASNPAALPGSVDAQGCGPRTSFPGAEVVDVPAEGLYNQELAATYDRHIDLAVAAGIRGFLVSWQGTGQAAQEPASSGYDRRLDLLVSRVRAYNAAHRATFGLGLAFAAYGDYSRPAVAIINDLNYFSSHYGKEPVFRNDYSAKPIVMWLDSRKYGLDTVRAVSTAEEPDVYLLGDETPSSWARDASYLDGTSYYWSTENPWTNQQAGSSLQRLASAVHQAGKRWFAPFIAGYNKELLGGTCVPRHGVETLQRVWDVNAASNPDGWFGISWNEFVENTYLEPSRAYGSAYLREVQRLSGH